MERAHLNARHQERTAWDHWFRKGLKSHLRIVYRDGRSVWGFYGGLDSLSHSSRSPHQTSLRRPPHQPNVPILTQTQAVTQGRPALSISVLGPFKISGAKRGIKRAPTCELIAYLALHLKGASRDELIEALWPAQDPRANPSALLAVSHRRTRSAC